VDVSVLSEAAAAVLYGSVAIFDLLWHLLAQHGTLDGPCRCVAVKGEEDAREDCLVLALN